MYDEPLDAKSTGDTMVIPWVLVSEISRLANHLVGDPAHKIDVSGLAVDGLPRVTLHRGELKDIDFLRSCPQRIIANEVL